MRENFPYRLNIENGHETRYYSSVHPFLDYARSKQRDVISLIRQMVECESPTDDRASVNRFVELMADHLAPVADLERLPGGRFGDHLRCRFHGTGDDGQILALGHSDTVWPLGTLASMPFREADGRLWGPGVLDMKSGVAFFLFAMQTLRELDVPVRRKVLLQLNSDEEVGSDSSRPLTEEAARRSDVVLVLEPGTGMSGKLKTARKGVGDYTVRVRGKAAHAGVDFTSGASAIVELAHQIEAIARFTDLDRGLTVNPGVISGGTRTNVIAAEAMAHVDVRIARLQDAAELDRSFRSLEARDSRCTVEVDGGLNRPPMERTEAIAGLFQTAKTLAAQIGVELEESATGGGSDGNFTAALGVTTLDGLGGVGEGAHAVRESILVDRIADRVALLALLLSSDSV